MVPGTSVLFVFLDGVGIGPRDPDRNPFLRADLPWLTRLTGAGPPTLEGEEQSSENGAVFPLDATLGVEGTPRSGTGQTALFTGRNAPRIHGAHFGPWTPVRLRPLLRSGNLLTRAGSAGFRVAFANAYPEGYPGTRSSRTVAAPALAARSAGLLVRHREELARGAAVASGIVNEDWRARPDHRDVPVVTPAEAGANLAAIARDHHLTVFAHYATDHAGHRGGMEGAVACLERVDRFLASVTAGLDDDILLLVASDHGNIEDIGVQHTRNPVLCILSGPGAGRRRAGLRDITDVADAALGWLEADAEASRL